MSTKINNDMKEVFSSRLRNARIISGLSMEKLANEVGVSKQMISKYEKAYSMPNSTILIKLANALNYKIDSFFNSVNVELGEVEFRKKSSLGKKKQKSLKAQVKNLLEKYIEVEEILAKPVEFNNPLKDFVINSMDDAETASEKLRSEWKLGYSPIQNIISVLENFNIKILEIDENIKDFDGLSTFVGDKFPVIVINKNFPAERKRFTLLHELAHLLLKINNKELKEERVCDRFAGAMLLPGVIVIRDFGVKRKKIQLNELYSLQKRYGISSNAIIYRLIDNGVINKEKLKEFHIRQNRNKDFKTQVNEVRYDIVESASRFQALVMRAFTQELISVSKASSLLQKDVSEIRSNLNFV